MRTVIEDHRAYAFGDFVLDTDREALIRDGRQVRLRPKSYEVLKFLLEQRGRLVTKQELLDLVWRDRDITEGSLCQCLVDIRKAIGDREHRMIRTVPRRGYIFDMPVIEHSAMPDIGPERPPRSGSLREWAQIGVVGSGIVLLSAILLWGIQNRAIMAESVDANALGTAEARRHYLHGNFFYKRRGPGDLQLAAKYYRAALETDPDLAPAWAGLAAVANVRYHKGEISRPAALAEMKQAVDRALALDPYLATAHLQACNYLSEIGELESAEPHFERAMELAPDDPLLLSVAAGRAAWRNQLQEAIELQAKAVALDPQGAVYHYNLAGYLQAAGRFGDARIAWIRAKELSPGLAAEIDTHLAFLHIQRREFQYALAEFQRMPPGADRDQGLALALQALGRVDEADAALERLIDSDEPGQAVRIAEVYAWRGEEETALRWASLAQQETSKAPRRLTGTDTAVELQFSPFLRALRGDPRWTAMLADIR